MRPLSPVALVTALLALLPSAPARADALLARPAGASGLVEARAALARGPSRSTAWYQLRVDPGADELLWVLPVPAGAAVDLSSSSFFDALEQSTAPRVLPPPGPAPKGQSCTKPTVQVVSGGDAAAIGALAGQDVFTDVPALVARATQDGYDAQALDAAALGSVVTAGGRLLVLRLSPPPASALEAETTVTVRVNGPGVGLEALPLLAGGPSGASLTLWLLGDGRGRVGGAAEIGIDPTTLRWTGGESTNYAARRDALLAPGAGASLVLEMAGPRSLHDTVSLPGGSLIPPLVDTYLRRVFERGEAPGDLGVFSGQAKEAVAGAIAEACPRGDLIAPATACQPGAGPAADVLVPATLADDLAFVYAGNAAGRWATRLAGLWPAQKSPPTLTADFITDESVSLLYTPAPVWDDLCQSSPTQGGGGQGGVGGSPGGQGGRSHGSGNRSGSTTGSGPEYVDDGSTVEDAATGVSCAAAFGNAMCSTANTGSDSESCDCNGSGGGDGGGESDGDDSSCSSGESGGSDGCGCGDSGSGDDGSGESCSGAGGDSSNTSCSGSDTSSGSGDSCGKCSTGRGRRSPPRLSKWLIVMTALALPLRRRTRPRREAVLPGSRDFRPIGVS